MAFKISDYLTDDETVYESFIRTAESSSDELDKIIAFMSMRPYAYVKNVSDADYNEIEKASTFFAHSLYCKSKRLSFRASNYNNAKLKKYIRKIRRSTKHMIDVDAIVGGYNFLGFDFEKLANLYKSVPLDCIDNMRKKCCL